MTLQVTDLNGWVSEFSELPKNSHNYQVQVSNLQLKVNAQSIELDEKTNYLEVLENATIRTNNHFNSWILKLKKKIDRITDKNSYLENSLQEFLKKENQMHKISYDECTFVHSSKYMPIPPHEKRSAEFKKYRNSKLRTIK